MNEWDRTIGTILAGFIITSIVLLALFYHPKETTTTPNIIIEGPECQINCTECLKVCSEIMDSQIQSYLKMRGIAQTIAIREGYQ